MGNEHAYLTKFMLQALNENKQLVMFLCLSIDYHFDEFSYSQFDFVSPFDSPLPIFTITTAD